MKFKETLKKCNKIFLHFFIQTRKLIDQVKSEFICPNKSHKKNSPAKKICNDIENFWYLLLGCLDCCPSKHGGLF
jgi:hypothetical protein